MKRIFSMVLTLTILAGLTAIPAFASTEAETVYFYNDFSKADNPHQIRGVGTSYTGSINAEDEVFDITKGTFVLDTSSASSAANSYVKVDYEEGQKPNLCVEYKIKAINFTGETGTSNDRFVGSWNTYGPDSVFIGGRVISAVSKKDAQTTADIPLISGTTNGNSYTVKIIYSATENIRTIYVNDICYGTFTNSGASSSAKGNWSTNSSNKFYFSFYTVGKTSKICSLDYVKVSKAKDMIKVPIDLSSDISLSTNATSPLWIPEGERVNLNLSIADGKSCSVKIGEETYIDSFYNDFTYKTPALSEDDTITIESSDKETELKSYTSPYSYQYEKEDGSKSVVVMGRKVDSEDYKPYTYGIFFSLTDPEVTVGAEGVNVLTAESNKDGNYAIEMFSPSLKSGDIIYYKSYIYYIPADAEDRETAQKTRCFGEVRSIVIE